MMIVVFSSTLTHGVKSSSLDYCIYCTLD